jgi:hypothetical protein
VVAHGDEEPVLVGVATRARSAGSPELPSATNVLLFDWIGSDAVDAGTAGISIMART